MNRILIALVMLVPACSDSDDPESDGTAEGGGEGDDGDEPNGETTERACYTIATCEAMPTPSATCSDERSDDANELAEQAKVTCGPVPTVDEQVPAWGACMAEQCGCSGADPATGAQVCE